MPDYDFAAERQFFNQTEKTNNYNDNGLEKIEGETFSSAVEPTEKTLNEEDMSWN